MRLTWGEFGELGQRRAHIPGTPAASTGRLPAETRGAAGELPLKAGEFPL